MRIGIVGTGAVGLNYGEHLLRAGNDVAFLFRSDYEAACLRGIENRVADQVYRHHPVEAFNDSRKMGGCDLVVIALKTTSNEALPSILPPLVGPGTRLLTLQNGLGNDDWLAGQFPENTVLGGLCFVCLNRIEPAVVLNLMPGSLMVGSLLQADAGHAREVVARFSEAGVKTRYAENLPLAQWKKLVWNVPFNGLCITHGGVTTDVVVRDSKLRQEARDLMGEVIDGASAMGLTIDRSFIDAQMEVTETMGAYRPSSMIDFVEGRRVEVESIWGEPLRRAVAAGATLPKLEQLYQALKRLCKN